MKYFTRSTMLGAAILGVLGGSTLLIGCSTSSNNPSLDQFLFFSSSPTPVVTTTASTPTFNQVEELGRPGINEALLITNAFLNGYNATQPQQQLTVPGPVIQAVSPLQLTPLGTEAAHTLTLLASAGDDSERVLDEVHAFLPDVLRIDTTIASPVGTPAYANGALVVENGQLLSAPSGTIEGRTVPVYMPIAGRKLEDDVISITYTVLTNGAVTTENVFFNDTASVAAEQHQVNDQPCPSNENACTTGLCPDNPNQEGGAAGFPYEAPPQ